MIDLKDKTINGLFWTFSQKVASQCVSFIVSIILARMLSPDEFGVVALAGMFSVLMGVFCDCGLGQVLIQRKKVDDVDLNTVFVTQLFFSCIVFCIVWFLAPFFAHVFNEERLTSVIRVLALIMPLGALAGVQNSVVSRGMMFKWYFYASAVSLFVSAFVGIVFAYYGYGVWALVFQNITSVVVSTIVVFLLMDWHPKFQFSFEHFQLLFSEGSKYLMTSLMGTFFGQLKGYCLGWKYTSSDLAYYNRGEGVPSLFCNNIDNAIMTVLFPAMSKIQNDKNAIRRAISRSIRISTFVICPMLFGLSAISDKLVLILYTEKWTQCVPYMQVLCFCLAIGILCNVNLQALKATGHIGLVLKLEFIKKPIMLAVIVVSMQISALAIVYGMLVFNVFVFFINTYPNKKIIQYSYLDQLRDVAPNILMALLMSFFVYCIGRIDVNVYLLICVQILFGVAFYLGLSYFTNNDSFIYLCDFANEKLRKRK